MRRRMGAAALDMDAASDGSWQTQWRATVAARLPSQRWPQRTVLITAVDAHTGEPVVFDRYSGVDLADAVAASCASGLPYRTGTADTSTAATDRNAENADLAAGYGAGAGAVALRRQNAARRWTGACISRRRSTSYAHAAAASRRSSRTATPSTCSAPMRWIRRCVRPLLGLVITKAETLAEQLSEFWALTLSKSVTRSACSETCSCPEADGAGRAETDESGLRPHRPVSAGSIAPGGWPSGRRRRS